jgi:hypothetical protein
MAASDSENESFFEALKSFQGSKSNSFLTYKLNKRFNADLLNLSAMRLAAARASLLASPT